MISYLGKTALITGASSGIGEEFAKQLARKGCDLILVARSEDRLLALAEKLTKECRIKACSIPVDLSKRDSVEDLMGKIRDLHLSVDILINNAGFATYGDFVTTRLDRQIEEISLNVVTLVALTHHILTDMLHKKAGVVINLASVAAFQPMPHTAIYGATKAFVLSFSEALWAENKNNGIKIMALCPGPTSTAFFNVAEAKEAFSSTSKKSAVFVVKKALRSVARDKSYFIPGAKNYMLSHASRFMSRKTTIRIVKTMTRPPRQN